MYQGGMQPAPAGQQFYGAAPAQAAPAGHPLMAIHSYVINFSGGCCPTTTYNFYGAGGMHSPVFSGLVTTPCIPGPCCDTTVPILDASKRAAITPTIGYCGWSVKDGNGTTVGHVEPPTCCQKLMSVFSPCSQQVLLRGTDSNSADRFTIRADGCCNLICPTCCEGGCCKDGCKCDCAPCMKCVDKCCCKEKPFERTIHVYSGDLAQQAAVAAINFKGTLTCCTGRVKLGYVTSIQFPGGCSFNDAAILTLMAMYLDELLVGPMRAHPICGCAI
jgi:hypothetical protein